MRYHVDAAGHPLVTCHAARGACLVCERCNPSHPSHDPAYAAWCRVADLGPDVLPVAAAIPPPAAGTLLAGDVVEMAARRLGADRLARWLAAKLGADCNCEARRVALNALDIKIRRYLARPGR